MDQALAIKKQARSEFLPRLSTSYGYTRFSDAKESTGFALQLPPPIGNVNVPPQKLSSLDNYQWKVSLTQPIFTGFALLSRYELARLGIDISKLELEQEKLALVLRVKEAYFNVLRAQRAVEVSDKAVESLASHMKVARSFYEVGMIPANDLLKAEVELANARHIQAEARSNLKLAKSRLNTVISRPIDAPLTLEDILSFRPERETLSHYIQTALDQRPELKALSLRIAQAEQEIRLAKSKYFPEIVLTASYVREGDDPDVSGSPYHNPYKYWQASAMLNWTFWEWGKTYYQVREKEEKLKELTFLRKSLEEQIRLEVKRAFLALDVAEKNIPRAKKAVIQAEENLRVARERYKAQVSTSTEVLDAQALLTQARNNYYNALYDHNMARARLLWAIGSLETGP